MAESPKKKTPGGKVAAVPEVGGRGTARPEPNEAAAHLESACPVALCPICAAVTLMRPFNPEVIEHLLNAGREFLMAAKAGLDTITADSTQDDDRSFEKIDIG